jgi:hypothetical protein
MGKKDKNKDTKKQKQKSHEEEDDEIMYHELELLCELQTNGQ